MTAQRDAAMTDSTSWTGPAQTARLTAFKTVGVVASALLLLMLAARTAGALIAGAPWPLLVPGAFLGYLCADLLSGTAHWFCDTFFDARTPIIGPTVIQPFRDHHEHPSRIARYRFIQQDTTNFFIMIPLLLAALRLSADDPARPLSLWTSSFVGALALGAYGTNLFHKWAHASTVPRGVRWLQRRGLILTPARHHAHHADHSRSFCVTSGWMNPLLDAIRFFPSLEAAARSVRRGRGDAGAAAIDGRQPASEP
jgi:ubiquitin-conjugating enzyme E2 variant